MPNTQPSYASAYAAHGRRVKTSEPALVIAPGSHTTRLGFAGAPVPAASLPAATLPLQPAGAFASALVFAAAEHLHLSSTLLRTHTLIFAVPPTNFPPVARAAIAHATTHLLRMPRLILIPSAPAAAIAVGAAHGGARAIVVDVGWTGARVCSGATGAPRAAAPAGMRDVAAALHEAGVAPTDMDTAFSTVYLRPEEAAADKDWSAGGPALGEEGQVVVDARTRWGSTEVLFNDGQLAEAVVEVLQERDVDGRAAGARWVVACGGAAGVPGFAARLQREVAAALSGSVGARVRVLCGGPAATWIGASLLGCVGRERYGDGIEVVEAAHGRLIAEVGEAQNIRL